MLLGVDIMVRVTQRQEEGWLVAIMDDELLTQHVNLWADQTHAGTLA
jgi:hypothetical protein